MKQGYVQMNPVTPVMFVSKCRRNRSLQQDTRQKLNPGTGTLEEPYGEPSGDVQRLLKKRLQNFLKNHLKNLSEPIRTNIIGLDASNRKRVE